MENYFFLKKYVTSEGAVSHNVLYYQQLSITHYQLRFYANNYFECPLPLSKILYHSCYVIQYGDGTLSCTSKLKGTQNTYLERVGVSPCVSGSHTKHPCLQVFSGLRATVIRFTYEASWFQLAYQKYNKTIIIKI